MYLASTEFTEFPPSFRFLDGSFTTRHLFAHKTKKIKNCTPPSIEEFPNDLFNQYQRQHGAVIVNFAVAFYMFWAIAIVCDDYFVPCLEIICDKMGLQSDVAGATFMALGSSAPELFASVIGKYLKRDCVKRVRLEVKTRVAFLVIQRLQTKWWSSQKLISVANQREEFHTNASTTDSINEKAQGLFRPDSIVNFSSWTAPCPPWKCRLLLATAIRE